MTRTRTQDKPAFFGAALTLYVPPDTTKSASELQGEQALLSELMRTVERRDTLVSLLEEQRLRERDEDRDLESLSRGYELHWSPGQSMGWWDNLEGSGVESGSQGDALG